MQNTDFMEADLLENADGIKEEVIANNSVPSGGYFFRSLQHLWKIVGQWIRDLLLFIIYFYKFSTKEIATEQNVAVIRCC